MSFISRLRDLLQATTAAGEAGPDEHERLTVAALLALVARIDGRVLDVERNGLRTILRSHFGLSDEGVERILAHAEEIGGDVDETAQLTGRVLHEIDPADRPRLLAMAYRIAAIDGHVHEFEEDLIWRVGRLLGLDDDEVAKIGQDAMANLAPERARLA
jgi:uncharacterized tellurite resistance protein B-like protein